LGGSAGREGAALQLGGGVATLVGKVFRLDEKSRHVITMCGMGAFFSAIFGTPLGAFVFAIEVVCVGHFSSVAVFPGLVSSVTAFWIAHSLGAEAERFPLNSVPELSFKSFGITLLVALAGALVSVLFCYALHHTSRAFSKWFKNEYLKIAVGGLMIALLTVIVGTGDYNGGGINVIMRIFENGEVRYEAFALKILFTAITVAAGYKGGEIIPTLFIGATLGGALGVLLGISPAFGAALGMAALFCGVTNCPIATILLCIEMFGADGSIYFALAAITSFLLSGYVSLYSSQKVVFSKWCEELREN
jgi:H+/Cl- antiporter ClcA